MDAQPFDWFDWHNAYEDPDSSLSWRLRFIQQHIRNELEERPPGPIRVISICAGQGRDLIGALAGHPRRADVVARLIELDERNVDIGLGLLAESGLSGIEFLAGDASSTSAYAGAVPADLILACGFLGSTGDVRQAIQLFSSMSSDGASVVWTHNTRPPNHTPTVRRWFVEAGYEEVAFEVSPVSGLEVVGVNRLGVKPTTFEPGQTIFEWVGFENVGPQFET